MTATDEVKILIVDDEEPLVDLFYHHLNGKYDVRKAYGGKQALQKADETIDVVLLDRRMPDLSGDQVLARIRMNNYDCRVVMVTAVSPETDIVEMPFDDYIQKPIDKKTLSEAIDHQLTIKEYGETYQELSRVYSKIDVLEREKSTDELEQLTEYQELTEKVERLSTKQEVLLDELDYFETASAW